MSTPTATLAAALREAAGILEQSGLHVDRDACQSYASNPEARMMQWAEGGEPGARFVALHFCPTTQHQELRWAASACTGSTCLYRYNGASRDEACRKLMVALDGDRAAKEGNHDA